MAELETAFSWLYGVSVFGFLICFALSLSTNDYDKSEFWDYVGVALMLWPPVLLMAVPVFSLWLTGKFIRAVTGIVVTYMATARLHLANPDKPHRGGK